MPSKPVYSDKYAPCPICRERKATLHREIACVGMGYAVTCWCGVRSKVMNTEEEAVLIWQAMPRDQTWTPDMPTQIGWYWMRHSVSGHQAIVYVSEVKQRGVIMDYYEPGRGFVQSIYVQNGEGYEWSNVPIKLPFDIRALHKAWSDAVVKELTHGWGDAVLTAAEHVIQDMTPDMVRENLSRRDKD